MKHTIKITIILLSIFFLSQYIGLAVVNQYIDHDQTKITGETTFSNLPLGERPVMDQNTSYILVIAAVLIGTALLFGIIKLGAMRLWKAWFALALFITLTTSFAAFTTTFIAISLAIIFTSWRIFKNNPIIHNATEPLIYAGIAAIFVPIFNLFSISILLILIAIYDAYAVWKSKHMIVLAKAQKKAGIFAGLQIPHQWSLKKSTTDNKVISTSKQTTTSKQATTSKSKVPKFKEAKDIKKKGKVIKAHSAILGGGDIAFPLLFAGVLLKDYSMTAALILPIFATAALSILFYYSEKRKFYPAMPFIGAGCFVGLGFLSLVGLI
jgi:presenilin-like A22 family membrane protease